MSHRFLLLEERWKSYKRAYYMRLLAGILLGILLLLASYFAFVRFFMHERVQELEVRIQREDEHPIAITKYPQNLNKTHASYSKVREDSEHCFIVQAMVLNIRENPSLDAKILSRYVRGDKICAQSIHEHWVHSGIGWVYNAPKTLLSIREAQEREKLQASEPKQISQPQNSLRDNRPSSAPRASFEESSSLRITSSSSSPAEVRGFLHAEYEREASYDTAIELARNYYLSKEYKLAREWALVANKHESNSVESWAIFSKSLYFSGEKDEAMNVLQRYESFDVSGTLSRLLEDMRADKIKE